MLSPISATHREVIRRYRLENHGAYFHACYKSIRTLLLQDVSISVACGCQCVTVCNPEECSCSLNKIKCQVSDGGPALFPTSEKDNSSAMCREINILSKPLFRQCAIFVDLDAVLGNSVHEPPGYPSQ